MQLELAGATRELPNTKPNYCRNRNLVMLQQLREQGQVVAMLGDGINDAPALAAADVGIALSDGADISRDAAAICLWHDDLTRIPWALRHARRAVRTIHRNLLWARCYNVVGIGFAASGCLNPILAAVAMIGSSLLVIVESLRLADRPVDSDPSFTERSEPADHSRGAAASVTSHLANRTESSLNLYD